MENICIKYYLEDTKQKASEYLQSVDKLAGQKAEELQANKAELDKMRDSGIYSKNYIDNYVFEEKKPYRECLRRTAELKKPRLEHNLECIKKSIIDYFNAPLNADLSNKLAMYKQLGVKPSIKEMQLLEGTASSYADKRIFSQFAEEVGYNYATVPDLDRVMKSLDDYLSSALHIFDYSGEGAELINYIDRYNADDYGNPRTPQTLDKAISSSAGAFIKNNATDLFIKFLNDTGIDLEVKPLSDEEIELIEELIQSEKYPYSIATNVKQYAENDIIRDLLLRHEEYRKYLL